MHEKTKDRTEGMISAADHSKNCWLQDFRSRMTVEDSRGHLDLNRFLSILNPVEGDLSVRFYDHLRNVAGVREVIKGHAIKTDDSSTRPDESEISQCSQIESKNVENINLGFVEDSPMTTNDNPVNPDDLSSCDTVSTDEEMTSISDVDETNLWSSTTPESTCESPVKSAQHPGWNPEVLQTLSGSGTGGVGLKGQLVLEYLEQMSAFTHRQLLEVLFNLYAVQQDDMNSIDAASFREILRITGNSGDGALGGLGDSLLDTIALMFMEKIESQKNADYDDKVMTFTEFYETLNDYPDILNKLNLCPWHWLRNNCDILSVFSSNLPDVSTSSSSLQTPFEEALEVDKWRKRRMSDMIRRKEFEGKVVRTSPDVSSRCMCLSIYVVVNVILFIYNALRYKDVNVNIMIARGFGMCLNLNCALVIVPILRHSLTWLSARRIAAYLPVFDGVFYHKVIGMAIVFQTIGHVIPHLINLHNLTSATDTIALNSSLYTNKSITTGPLNFWRGLFWTDIKIGWVCDGGLAFPTGASATLVLLVMSLFSLPVIRRSGLFELFYWTHALAGLFWVLMIIHAPSFWKYYVIPGVIYFGEKIYRTDIVRRWKYGKLFITEANILPSKVSHLVIQRPENFKYNAGDYIFVKIPCIAGYEWHPFTISSCPELHDELWIHVRTLGDWTNSLYEYISMIPSNYNKSANQSAKVKISNGADYFSRILSKSIKSSRYQSIKKKFSQKIKRKSGDPNEKKDTRFAGEGEIKNSARIQVEKDTYVQSLSKNVRIPIQIDGPYSTAAVGIMDRTEHAVLIAGGIGVTPFASILQSFMYRHLSMRRTCKNCKHVCYDKYMSNVKGVKKVDFIWVNRDQKNFEWFLNILAQLEMLQTEQVESGSRVLNMRIYMTGARSADDLRPLSLQVALERIRRKQSLALEAQSHPVDTSRDTPPDTPPRAGENDSLNTMIRSGRPDFNEILSEINDHRRGQVKVYTCGPSKMAAKVKQASLRYGFEYLKEHF